LFVPFPVRVFALSSAWPIFVPGPPVPQPLPRFFPPKPLLHRRQPAVLSTRPSLCDSLSLFHDESCLRPHCLPSFLSHGPFPSFDIWSLLPFSSLRGPASAEVPLTDTGFCASFLSRFFWAKKPSSPCPSRSFPPPNLFSHFWICFLFMITNHYAVLESMFDIFVKGLCFGRRWVF